MTEIEVLFLRKNLILFLQGNEILIGMRDIDYVQNFAAYISPLEPMSLKIPKEKHAEVIAKIAQLMKSKFLREYTRKYTIK